MLNILNLKTNQTKFRTKLIALNFLMKMTQFRLDEDHQNSNDKDDDLKEDEAPIVKYINKLLIDAIRMGASDLHFEPYEKSYRVRYRRDGVLRTIANPPLQLATLVLPSRLKSCHKWTFLKRFSRWPY